MALLLLRFAAAMAAFPVFAGLSPPGPASSLGVIGASIVALSLVSGLGTRFAAALLAVLAIPASLSATGDAGLVLPAHAGACAALCLLGPGLFDRCLGLRPPCGSGRAPLPKTRE